MKKSEIKASKNHERLRTLYAVSKLLANFQDIDKSFSEIISSAAESFPLLTAVLVDNWEHKQQTTIWHSADATNEQIEQSILHARNAHIYLLGASIIESAHINKEIAPHKALRRNSNTLTSDFNNLNNYIVLPLVIDKLPPFGTLQLEGVGLLDEDDLEFVGALADLVCVSLDRHYKTKRELDFSHNELIEGTAKLSYSKGKVTALEHERQLREVFVSLLTHDLRTPLTSALLAANLIVRKSKDPEMCALLANKIAANINRIEQMVNNLLDANLIRSGEQVSLNIESINLHHLIKNTIEELITIHGERMVLVGSDNIEGHWDKKGIGRIVENLITNAIKYGLDETPVTIFIEQNLELQTVRIRVHNEGEVISLNDQAFLFDQYRRSEQLLKNKKKGWGLGLTLVRGVTEAHGGNVTVESEIEIGTNFIVTLPINSNL